MMAQPYPAHAGMGPGHPGMPHGHPMGGVHHPGGQMGHPNPGMMQGMHPGMNGPQVTQGPMVSGMPPNSGTPAPGGPMQPNMAMAHLAGPQGQMFQGQNPQINLGQQMQMNQAQLMAARQKALLAQQGGQMPPGMMNMTNMPQFNQAQMAQMRMGMPMQQMGHMTPQQSALQQQQQYQQQQRIMAQQAAHQQAMAQAQRQQQQQAQAQQAQQQQAQAQQQQQQQAAQQQQVNASQQMQMSRSQEPATQPPQPQSTPAPQAQAQSQAQSASQPQQTPQQQPKPTPQPANAQVPQPQNAPTPQIKQGEQEEETQIKPEMAHQQQQAQQQAQAQAQVQQQQQMMQDLARQQENFTGQCILQLLLYQDNLANPDSPNDLAYWHSIIQKYFSPFGSLRQQVFNHKTHNDKSFQLQYPSLARFYHSHFKNGIKQILMQSFDHNQSKLPNGGVHIWSEKASLTYVFRNDLRITTQGSVRVTFDDMQKIEHLNITTTNWTEYIPRPALLASLSLSPEQNKQSPKMKKNQQKTQQRTLPGQLATTMPSTGCSDWGLPEPLLEFLEIAEVITAMGPLMTYFHDNPGYGPREALMRINAESNQLQRSFAMAQAQNAQAMAANGQLQFQNPRMGMNPPNQFQSPALSHLNLPQGQSSPHMGGPNHTPSPAQNAQGGVAMMHQMSAQGSNLSGSAGASTNTSPNVSNKRRRASAIKAEEDTPGQGGDGKVKPSPRMGGKRQKGAAS